MKIRKVQHGSGAFTLCSALLVASCSGEAPPVLPQDAGVDRAVDVPPALPAVRLVVDSDRNGRLDDSRVEFDHRAEWSTTFGAMLMANVDDDDSDHVVDAVDDAVNGEADAEDLARFRVAAWPQCPTGATGTLTLGETETSRVRLFRHAGSEWTLFTPGESSLTTEELREGVEFGIEAKDFPSFAWNGNVEITLSVDNTGEMQMQVDRATLRTAPWVMYNSLDPALGIYGPRADGYGPADVFTRDLVDIAKNTGTQLTLVNTLDAAYRSGATGARREGPDVWMQDIMEFGWTGFPGPNGLRSMPVVLRTPPNTRIVARYTERELLAPDFGYVWKRASQAVNGRQWDPSLDSFGDLELIPPHTHGDRHFPMGRMIHGSIDARHSDVELRRFLDAQGVQGPPLYVDTSWLHVGHIDEVLSFVPVEGGRGWKILIASPRLARTLWMEFVARDPANAGLTMFEGQYFYYDSGPMMGRGYSAARSVGNMLADATLMAFNQRVQARIDALREQLMEEAGLSDSDFVEIPFLLDSHERERAGAYMPGTVNLLYFNHNAVVARPHSVVVDDRDIFEDDMTERLRPFGITVHFAEQWDILHAAQGEVHCGTNAVREVSQTRWWEVAR
jgi:protein-arginine deiminase